MRVDYTTIKYPITVRCEYCLTSFPAEVAASTHKQAQKQAQYVSCPACGLFPSKSTRSRSRSRQLLILYFIPLILPLGGYSLAMLANQDIRGFYRLVPFLIFMTFVCIAYRKWLPHGIDLNAPALARKRLSRAQVEGMPQTPGAPMSGYLGLLMLVSILSLFAVSISSLGLIDYSQPRLIFAVSATLVFACLYLARKHLYSAEEENSEFETLGLSSIQTNDAGVRCVSCAKTVKNFHYSFESIDLAGSLGSQCSKCGKLLCKDHSRDYAAMASAELRCSNCGGEIIWLHEGPAYSSMVDAAKRKGLYNQHIHPPSLDRQVIVE